MERLAFSILYIFSIVGLTLGDPRAQILQLTCSNKTEVNATGYIINFVATMETVSAQIQNQGYGLAVTGQAPDAVYSLAQCYGDLSLQDCVICYAQARSVIPKCFPQNGGKMYLDGCFMRIENYTFFQEYTGPEDRVVCGNRTRKNSTFQETTIRAVLQAASYAQNNNGYAQAELPVSGTTNESAYILANCWKTVNASSCRACLENASNSIMGCLPWSEGRALNTGCIMRYSDTNFFNPIQSNGSSSGTPAALIAAVISSTIVGAGATTIVAYIWKYRRILKKRKGNYDVKKFAKILRDSGLNFKYSTLQKATGGFDEANKLGQGGYGIVYKGILPDGRAIAIKRLFLNNIHRTTEFYNEINIISSIEHKNLVRLLGCSCYGPDSLLVYEFLPNKSLDSFIFGEETTSDSNEHRALNWKKRFVIIIGIAEGLVYLHTNPKIRIIHRDIKASNILLDERFCAKIADFGLARAFQEDKSHISTKVAGTLGYMAPEYLSYGQLTEKADVYSFGVLLLEIIRGRHNNSSTTSDHSYESLVTIAWKHFQQGTTDELIDPSLMSHDDNHNISTKNEALRVIHVGLLCTQEIPSLRPSMSEALQMLVKQDEHLRPPTKPPFIYEGITENNGTSFPLIAGKPDSIATISHSIFNPR